MKEKATNKVMRKDGDGEGSELTTISQSKINFNFISVDSSANTQRTT